MSSVYEIGHRHGPGANVMYLSGHGYSLIWPPEIGEHPFRDGKGSKVIRVDWGPNTVFVPPSNWYHQHFNPNKEPARFLKVGAFGSRVHIMASKEVFQEYPVVIEYQNEDPAIRKMFEQECAKNGVTSIMPSVERMMQVAKEEKRKAPQVSAANAKCRRRTFIATRRPQSGRRRPAAAVHQDGRRMDAQALEPVKLMPFFFLTVWGRAMPCRKPFDAARPENCWFRGEPGRVWPCPSSFYIVSREPLPYGRGSVSALISYSSATEPRPSEAVKECKPPMNTINADWKTKCYRVHLR